MFLFYRLKFYVKSTLASYNFKFRNLAFAITETELKLIANAAIIGESKRPKKIKPLPQSSSEYIIKAKINFDEYFHYSNTFFIDIPELL
jgi:hypothetical protein